MRAISTVSMPQRPAASAPSAIDVSSAAARTTSAALVPPNPRDRTSATSLRGACADADTGQPRARRIEPLQRRDARHRPRAQRREREDRLDDSRRGEQMAERPLERGDRRRRGAEDAPERARLRRVRLPRAVAVRDDHPDVGGAKSRVLERERDRAREPVAVVADRQQPFALAGAAAAEDLAEHGRAARGRRALRSRGPAPPAPSPIRLPLRATSNGRSASSRQQPDAVVVEHHLRLDRRVVPDRDGALALAGPQRLRRLDDRERAADAVVGDAGVRTLQAVPDADVAEHVVRQRPQQPHRVDGGAELAAERRRGCRRPRRAAGRSRTGSGSAPPPEPT